MRFWVSLASVASICTASAIHKHAHGLGVKLTSEGNTLVKAAITNTGQTALNLLNKGTFLDSAAIEKVTVHSMGKFYSLLFHTTSFPSLYRNL